MTTRTLLLLGLVAGALACAKSRGFDRGKLDSDLSQAALVTDEDILMTAWDREFHQGSAFLT